MLCLLAKQFPARKIHGVGDAAYASGAFAGLPENVTITSRLRSDAALSRSCNWAESFIGQFCRRFG